MTSPAFNSPAALLIAAAALKTPLTMAECTTAFAPWLIPTVPLTLGIEIISPSTAVPSFLHPRSSITVPPMREMPDGSSSCARFQLPSISQIVMPLPFAPPNCQTSAAPMPFGAACR